MRRRFTVHRVAPGHVPSNRLAWWAAFLATLALIALLSAVRADAAVLPPGGPSLPRLALAEPEEEAEDALAEEETGLEEFEECGGDEEEVEECVEEAAEAGSGAPSGCGLARAEARLTLNPTGLMRLTIRYTADAPTTVAIEYRSASARGSLRLKGGRHRLHGTGALHESRLLNSHQTALAMAARSFTLELRPLAGGRACERRLSLKRPSRHSPVWLAS